MVFYGAVLSVLNGEIALMFDGDAFTDFLNGRFASWLSQPLAYRPWAYPPSFLLLLPFAPLGFFGSYLTFQATTAGLMAIALRSCVTNLMAQTSRRGDAALSGGGHQCH
jgi:hypothetical protein